MAKLPDRTPATQPASPCRTEHSDLGMTARYADVMDMAKKNPALFIPVRNMKTSLIGARLEELALHMKAVSNILLALSIAFC